MSATNRDVTTRLPERTLVVSREFDARRELVFRAWTDPQQVVQWWGPDGFTTTTYQMDVRPGGVWCFTMHGPDGVDYPNEIVYSEVVEPEQLAYRHSSGDDAPVEAKFEVTVTFEQRSERTLVTMQLLFESNKERDRVIEKSGALEGAQQTFGRLADHLARVESAAEKG